MHPQLREFLVRWAGIVVMSLVPVVFTAFVTTAPVLEHLSPGYAAEAGAPAEHMT